MTNPLCNDTKGASHDMYAVESDNHDNITNHKSENALICKCGYNQTEYMLVVVMHVMIIVVIMVDM